MYKGGGGGRWRREGEGIDREGLGFYEAFVGVFSVEGVEDGVSFSLLSSFCGDLVVVGVVSSFGVSYTFC